MGLTVCARADAAITDGRLISKTEAIARMVDLEVPPAIVAGVARRRDGRPVPMSDAERQERADVVHRFLTDEIARLLGPAAGPWAH
jgi:hypothetical protein